MSNTPSLEAALMAWVSQAAWPSSNTAMLAGSSALRATPSPARSRPMPSISQGGGGFRLADTSDHDIQDVIAEGDRLASACNGGSLNWLTVAILAGFAPWIVYWVLVG